MSHNLFTYDNIITNDIFDNIKKPLKGLDITILVSGDIVAGLDVKMSLSNFIDMWLGASSGWNRNDSNSVIFAKLLKLIGDIILLSSNQDYTHCVGTDLGEAVIKLYNPTSMAK